MAYTTETQIALPDAAPSPQGNLAGTQHLGIIFTELVSLERKVGGVWTSIASGLPATFEPVNLHRRAEMESWTHKPLFCLWLMPDAPVQDGDRVIRSDSSCWYVRGAPLVAPMRTHMVALAESASEDGLFAARTASEPA